jgi:hypothetical protein
MVLMLARVDFAPSSATWVAFDFADLSGLVKSHCLPPAKGSLPAQLYEKPSPNLHKILDATPPN